MSNKYFKEIEYKEVNDSIFSFREKSIAYIRECLSMEIKEND